MNRKEFISNILQQIHFSVETIGINGILQMIEEFKRENNIIGYREMNCKVNDGYLSINNKPVGRIASKIPKIILSEESYILEGKCIGA